MTIRYIVLTMPLTTLTDPSRPAKLLSQLSLYPNPSLWGFPIKSTHILAEFHKTITPETDDDAHLFSYCSNYFSELENKCNDIWTSPKLRAACQQVRVNGKPMIIVAIVKCTHPDDRLLPPAEKIEEMRKVVVALGFKGEPGWFKL